MEIDTSAPVVARASIEVSADPGLVWDVVADFERWPAWNPDVKELSLGGPVAEGTEFRWKAGPSRITSTLQLVDRPRALGWTGRTFGIDAVHLWWFEADGAQTLATTAESWDGWLPRLLRAPMRGQLQHSLEAGLPRLKAEAERRAAG